ncbi:MAG: bacterial Ig-like domain-containing protein [Candidatus Pristimantibacillus sp.]
MRKQQRLLALVVSFLLLFSSYPLAVFADEDPYAGMIDIQSDWSGSVFGDVGGQDKITSTNFGITEHSGGSVTLRSSNDRGKISGSTEGIAYYFQEVDPAINFELKATAVVDAWTANNQVSFGIMLRGNVWENQFGAYTGDYVAVGALDQEMKALHKLQGGSLQKTAYTANRPAPGEEYELSIKKTGNLYLVRIGDETKTIESYDGSIQYAGLYTARNTTVTFRDVQLNVEGQVDLGPWAFSAFGGNTSPEKNPAPAADLQTTSVTVSTYGGKISSSDEGLSFYFKEIPIDANFELKAKATVVSFNSSSSISTPNQKSFGLMLRDSVGVNGDSSATTSNYAAVGALDQVMKSFYKKTTQVKLNPFSDTQAPTAGTEYMLSIKKSGNTYQLSIGNQSEIVTLDDTFTDTLFAGVYAARDAVVTFSDMDIQVETRTVRSLTADTSAMAKTSYLVGEALDLTGLVVKAQYSDNSEALLSPTDYIVTGFDSSAIGTKTVKINYNGASTSITIDIIPLSVTSLTVKYYPAKTTYYPGDNFDPEGLVVVANYNDGFQTTELTSDLYSFTIEGQSTSETSPYTFTQPGTFGVTITSTETPAMTTIFNVSVANAALTQLEVRKQPKQTLYFIGDSLQLEGLVLYAHYDDGTTLRLMNNEYTVSPLDTLSPGEKQITVTHKGMTASFPVTVKVKELVGIEVTSYPRTTFSINDHFDSTDLIVSKVYDNSDREALTQYSLDTAQFNNQAAGVYQIGIIPADISISPITYSVTVKELTIPVWSSTHFGQSSSAVNNQTSVRGDGSVELVALEGGGKVTGDHDGITFYYTELDAVEDNFVLSADIQVSAYAKTPYDGQESFGIMARDVNGTLGNSSVFASNIAAIGGYSGGTRSDNGTQLFVRTGVETTDGAGSKGIQAIMLKNERPSASNTYPAAPYRLTLSKTNSGFTGQLNNGQEAILFTPDILNVQDSKMYIGFYTARLATIAVSNIQLTVTSAATDSPRVEPPAIPVTPSLDILSLNKSSDPDYTLIVRPNVSGTVTVKQGAAFIAQDVAAEAGKRLSIPAMVAAQGDTSFSIAFLPDDTQHLTSYDKIVRNFTVTLKSYAENEDIYVSPNGNSLGDGTLNLPLDIDTAIEYVKSGQRIIVLDGRYVRKSPIEIKPYNDGRADAYKYLEAAPGTRPIFDFDKKSEGVILSGSYWHVKGLDFTRSADNTKGFTVGGHYNIVENSRFYANGDTGLQISRTDGTALEIEEWPSYNLILNSSSFDNRDPSDNNADGFAAKLTSGIGNIFRGCLAYNNIDDGWDLYTKAGSGAIGPVLIENSAAFNNGYLTDGTIGAGDKNGFKLGGEGIHVPHTIQNSIAFGNGAYGFASNSNPGVVSINNIGFNNTRGNLNLTTYAHIAADFTMNGFLSYHTEDIAKDQYPSSLDADNNFMFDGISSTNKSGKQLTDANFASLVPVTSYSRDSNGNIIWGDFLKFIAFDDTDPGEIPNPGNPGSDSSGTSGGSVDPSNPTVQSDGSVRINLPITNNQGKANAVLSETTLQKAIAMANLNSTGNTIIRINLTNEQTSNNNEYEITLPTSAFRIEASTLQLELNTPLATFILPGNIFRAAELVNAKTVTLLLRTVNVAGQLKERLGNRPILEYELRLDGQKVPLNSLNSVIQIGLPHPAVEPVADHAFIVVWDIDENGVILPVVNGGYDAARKQAIFKTNQPAGQFAAIYNPKTFQDISETHWAKLAIEILAAKGVIKGVSETEFMPEHTITRADFALLLVRVLGLSTTGGDSFADVNPDHYYYEELMTAKKLGIVNGQADGLYHPNTPIAREDMFVMTARALRAAGALESSTAASGSSIHLLTTAL